MLIFYLLNIIDYIFKSNKIKKQQTITIITTNNFIKKIHFYIYMKKENTFYITTPIYYASGKPHLGHAYTSIACDVLARWNRNIGKEVFFQTGTDEHGQKVANKAEEANKTPQEFVDELIPFFKEQLEKLNISHNYFIRTTDDKHKSFVQDMLSKSLQNGDIYKAKYSGLYCVDCERYYKEDELIDGKKCPDHKREVETMEEENYFFKLSKYEKKLLKFYEENPDFLSPKSKAQETINRVKEGLDDISISRNKETLEWGIEFPFDDSHVTYVWFDALFNYVSGLEINEKKDFWPADVHVVGKDIMWFHKVYWPAFLMSVEMKPPKKVYAHGWWTVEGEKMGKSMGNTLDPIEIAEKYGTDEFRYFVMSVGGFGDDLDFSQKVFNEKINNELNNDLGNLVSRVHTMTTKYFEGKVPVQEALTEDEAELMKKLNILKEFNSAMQQLKFNQAIDILWTAIRNTNAYINKVEPWKQTDKKRLKAIINTLIFAIKMFADYIDCFMPEKAQKIREQYNFEKGNFKKFENVKKGHKIGKKENLFQKITEEQTPQQKQPEPKKEEKQKEQQEKKSREITFSDLNLKVGKIISIKKHPEAEKLYIEEIDIGEEKPRQIISGLKDHYKEEELLNKKVIVVANLKPAKLRGEMSEGMVLAVEDENKKVGVIETDAEIGTNLECEKETANNKSQIKIDDFFKIQMISDGKNIYLNDKQIKIKNKIIKIDKDLKGNVC